MWTSGMRLGTDNPSVVHRTRGGSAANVAVMAARRVPTRFIGRVGADSTGGQLVEQLTSFGVDVRVQRAGVTGTIVALVDPTGERTLFPDRGAAALLEQIPDEWLTGTAVLHLPAYGFLTDGSSAALRNAAATVRRLGGAVTLDASAISLIEELGLARFRHLVDELRPAVLFANADEAQALGLLNTRPPAGCVHVIKSGPRSVTIVSHEGEPQLVEPPPMSDVRDTTGAGDAFAAGFLVAWIDGATPTDAAATGHAFAAEVLATPGAGGQVVASG